MFQSTVSTARAARFAKWAAIPAALALSGAVVAQSSYAAFSATTVNPTNNWAAGTVALSDDDANVAAFSAENLKPGSTGTKVIAVTSNGSLASAVKLYGTGASTTNALSSYVNLTITQGTGGTFSSGSGFTPLTTGANVYTGTLAGFASSATGYSTGLGTWATTGTAPETRTFQIKYTVDAAAPNSTQGGTAAIGFTWEAQNS